MLAYCNGALVPRRQVEGPAAVPPFPVPPSSGPMPIGATADGRAKKRLSGGLARKLRSFYESLKLQ